MLGSLTNKLPSLKMDGLLLEIGGVRWQHIDDVETVAIIDIAHGPGSMVERKFEMRFWDARYIDFTPYCSWRITSGYEQILQQVERDEIGVIECLGSDMLVNWNSQEPASEFCALSFECRHFVVSDGISATNVLAFAYPEIEEVVNAH